MRRALARGMPVLIGLATASCAALWGFEDATLVAGSGADAAVRDVGLPPDPRDAPDAGGRSSDAHELDANADRSAASDHDDAASRADAGVTHLTDAEATDSHMPEGHDSSVGHPRVDAVAPPPPTCMPPCGGGQACTRAVGGIDVCVESVSCVDSNDCDGPNCCVWLSEDSSIGRCQAGGPPAAVTCLCVDTPGRMGKGMCQGCGPPDAQTTASVDVCQMMGH